MARPVTLFTGQWADLPLEVVAEKASSFGYDGLELACWGDHFEVDKALEDDGYVQSRWDILRKYDLTCYAISAHLVSQCVCDDPIDERHKSILPERVWGDGDAEGVRQRAAQEIKDTARAAKKFGVKVVNGFTGSSIWKYLYFFPPTDDATVQAGFRDFADRWNPILDVFNEMDVRFALEVHPTEIAFDCASSIRTLEAIHHHSHFGFNFDPSHFAYQGVDYLGFLREFGDLIFNVHIKDVWWSDRPMPIGVFGGHTEFGTDGRFWDFRSPGRGRVDFEGIIRMLNHIDYQGPLTVEWEDPMMDREAGATEAASFTRALDFAPSQAAFDAAFSE